MPQHLYNHRYFGVAPMQAMAYAPPQRLPMPTELSMHLFDDSQVTQVASCTLIVVLALLTGVLIFFFVLGLGMSVHNEHVTTTAVSDYDIVVRAATRGDVNATAARKHEPQPSRGAVARAHNLAVSSEPPLKNEVGAEETIDTTMLRLIRWKALQAGVIGSQQRLDVN
ncbi:hypothetical protein V5799_005956 [Amblyomma americanum]|uniref:Uncharacterized protein n=1 Tax=Amblyomma americanum TaxID=6943 RepID=A0AAQ4DXR5_AMBAM